MSDKKKKVRLITSNPAQDLFWKETDLPNEAQEDCMHVINLIPELTGQEIEGFGGAITDAAVISYASLSDSAKKEVVEGYYSAEGLRYNMARVHINSCDFAAGNYTYVREGDETLESFDIAHDKEKIIPFLHEAVSMCGVASDGTVDFRFLASPWSPPAYMKSNKEMNHGGKLLEEYYSLWALYYVKYIESYAEQGIKIKYLTVQNEPEAVQTWDSCIYTAKEEGLFVRDYLAPALQKAGHGDVQIFIWDHNKEALFSRVNETMQVEGCDKLISGAAMHWYTGDHFDAIRAVKQKYPALRQFFTEGCVEYSRFADSGEVQKAEMYAHDMLGNLKAGIEAFLDWNILLDEKGGPNHVGNFCAAPMMCDGNGGVEKRTSYYYIGHFSRYIKRGAKQIMTSCYTDKVEQVAFQNPDGEIVLVLLNRTDNAVPVTIKEESVGCALQVEAHSIATVCIS